MPVRIFGYASLVFSLLLISSLVNAALPDGRLNGNQMPLPIVSRIKTQLSGAVVSRNGTILPSYTTVYTFDQLIDHNNPSLGTFKQRFWHSCEFYEPGGPIIIFTPGEENAQRYTHYLTNRTINGLIAQQQNGSTVVLEHRFFGLSNPYPDLTVESFKVHNIEQAVEDFVYFAKHAILPMPGGDDVTPSTTPWILIGGSYSGALTSYIKFTKPDVFWAGYSSSGVVQAITDFWQYFEPIRQYMPQNCSADISAVIAHIDDVFTYGDEAAINSIKSAFGLESLTHLDDVAGALRNTLWDWQSLQVYPGANTFYSSCDALEVKDGEKAPSSGWGLDHALSAWSSYWKDVYLNQLCPGISVLECLGTYDPTLPVYTNTTIDNAYRSWYWLVCNEFGFYQDGPPVGHPAIVTRLVQPSYDERQCQLMFPQAFSSPPVPRVEMTNRQYGGWDVQTDRMFFATGTRDPWLDATVWADDVHKQTTQTLIVAVGDGYHTSDMLTRSSVDGSIAAVQAQALAAMKRWLSEWTPPY